MSFSVQDFVREAQAQGARDREQIARFAALADETKAKLRGLHADLHTAFAELGAALLPSLDSISASTLADTLGMPEISRLWQQADDRAEWLDAQIREREASDTWKTRQSRELEAARVLDETTPLYHHAQAAWEKVANLPRMHELMQREYGTDRYPHRSALRFFKPEYLQDWKRADEAVAALGVANFAQAAQQYRERQEQVQVLGRTVEEQQAILRQVQDMEAERNGWVQERDNLPATLRAHIAARVSDLLQATPQLADRLPDGATIRARVQAIDGRQAQIRYLDGVQVQIERDRAEIEQRAARLRQERERYESNLYRYRNKSFSEEQFYKRFGRGDRWDKRWNRYNRTSTTVYTFRDYDRIAYYDGVSDFLWWDVMTDGRLDGNFIPEVAEYHARHPEYRFERAPQPRGDDGFTGGYDLGFDTGSRADNSYPGDFDLS